MLDTSNIPTIFNSKDRNPKSSTLDALKSSHVSFWVGYSIAEDEMITFPTMEELTGPNASKYITVMDSFKGSNNKSALVLVTRESDGNSRTSWFNLSVLTRQCINDAGEREDVDEFRTNMRAMDDDRERLIWLAGKTIKGTGVREARKQDFDKDTHKPIRGSFSPAKFIMIEVIETTALKNPFLKFSKTHY